MLQRQNLKYKLPSFDIACSWIILLVLFARQWLLPRASVPIGGIQLRGPKYFFGSPFNQIPNRLFQKRTVKAKRGVGKKSYSCHESRQQESASIAGGSRDISMYPVPGNRTQKTIGGRKKKRRSKTL